MKTRTAAFIRYDNPQQPSAATCYEINIFDANPNRGNATGAIVNVQSRPGSTNSAALERGRNRGKGAQLTVSVNGERTAAFRTRTRSRPHRVAALRRRGAVA
jgi:hypothetical protein